ncbi:MAG: hypothetical protein U0641_17740 [Anaerolineae bacterium]
MSNEDELFVVEVTEEDYAADLGGGLHADEVLPPGRHVFRRGAFLARHNLASDQSASDAGVLVTVPAHFDGDQIKLDVAVDLKPGARLLVTILD